MENEGWVLGVGGGLSQRSLLAGSAFAYDEPARICIRSPEDLHTGAPAAPGDWSSSVGFVFFSLKKKE